MRDFHEQCCPEHKITPLWTLVWTYFLRSSGKATDHSDWKTGDTFINKWPSIFLQRLKSLARKEYKNCSMDLLCKDQLLKRGPNLKVLNFAVLKNRRVYQLYWWLVSEVRLPKVDKVQDFLSIERAWKKIMKTTAPRALPLLMLIEEILKPFS